MDKELIINTLKKNKKNLESNFHISRIGLFGSFSTNASTEESDIDLIYELKKGKRFGLKEIHHLEAYLRDILNIDKVDLVNQKYINPIVEDEIHKTVIYV